MDFDIEKFSYRLTVLLEEHNMNQIQLAKAVGTSNVTICRYINGERTPRIDVITRIASVFGVSLDYLIGLSESRVSNSFTNTTDLDTAIFMKKFYNLDSNSHFNKKQIELTKNLLKANKEFILSAK